eukprot:gene8084-10951_t
MYSIVNNSYKWFYIMLLFNTAVELSSIWLMYTLSSLYGSIADQDKNKFNSSIMKSCVAVTIISISQSVRGFAKDKMALEMRSQLIEYIKKYYFKAVINNSTSFQSHQNYNNNHSNTYCKTLDNTDQRITEDIDKLTTLVSLVLDNIVLSPLVLLFYTIYTWTLLGWSAPIICYSYFIFGTIISSFLSKPLVSITYFQEQLEGNFRSFHASFISNVIPITLLNGQDYEQARSSFIFKKLYNNKTNFIIRSFYLKLFTKWFDYAGSIVNYVAVGLSCFYVLNNHNSSYDNLTISNDNNKNGNNSSNSIKLFAAGSYACLYIINCFSKLLESAEGFSQIIGLSKRVIELIDLCDHYQNNSNNNSSNYNNINNNRNNYFVSNHENIQCKVMLMELKNIDLFSLNYNNFECEQSLLIKQLSLAITPGMKILITGASGAGKTTLLKTLHQFINNPQLGTLQANLLYPLVTMANHQENINDYDLNRMEYVLKICSLSHFIPYLHKPITAISNSIDNNNDRKDLSDKNCQSSYFEIDNIMIPMGVNDEARNTEDNNVNNHGCYMSVNMDMTSLPERDWPNTISSGEQQRLSLARMLLHKPKLAMFDEITSALDATTEEVIYNLISTHFETYLSVGHHQALHKYHTHELSILSSYKYQFSEIKQK